MPSYSTFVSGIRDVFVGFQGSCSYIFCFKQIISIHFWISILYFAIYLVLPVWDIDLRFHQCFSCFRGGHMSDSLNSHNISDAYNMPTLKCVLECKHLPLKRLSCPDHLSFHAWPSCSSGRCHIGPDIEDRRKTLGAPLMTLPLTLPLMTLPPPLTPLHFSSPSSFEGSP